MSILHTKRQFPNSAVYLFAKGAAKGFNDGTSISLSTTTGESRCDLLLPINGGRQHKRGRKLLSCDQVTEGTLIKRDGQTGLRVVGQRSNQRPPFVTTQPTRLMMSFATSKLAAFYQAIITTTIVGVVHHHRCRDRKFFNKKRNLTPSAAFIVLRYQILTY